LELGRIQIESAHYGGIIRVVPLEATSYDIWNRYSDKIDLNIYGPAVPATHNYKDYIYHTIFADKPLTRDEAADIMAFPPTKKVCLLGKLHWQDFTGRYETLQFTCLQHEGAGDHYFSIGTAEQNNSEQVLSQ
jgi:hypothetical protein